MDRYSTEIVANEMQMLDSRGAGQGGGSQSHDDYAQNAPRAAGPSGGGAQSVGSGAPAGDYGNFDDDIPF